MLPNLPCKKEDYHLQKADVLALDPSYKGGIHEYPHSTRLV